MYREMINEQIKNYYNVENLEFFNADCMYLMKNFKDKEFDLAIVDPPYGINVAKTGRVGGNNAGKAKDYGAKEWDKQPPNDEYFRQLFRVSKNQIVWGANHFISKMPFDSSCWIVFDKDNSGNFADCELAWTSFDTAVRKFQWRWNGMLQQNMKDKEERIHPTQKPVQLYEWILMNYAQPNDKIIDTHLGSGSIAIAIDKANTIDNKNFTFVGIELNSDYFNASIQRFKNYKNQLTIF